jgi:hypothetical protein
LRNRKEAKENADKQNYEFEIGNSNTILSGKRR